MEADCATCGKPWQEHYRENGRWKMGPFGTFDLIADHTPYIPGVHAERLDKRVVATDDANPKIPEEGTHG